MEYDTTLPLMVAVLQGVSGQGIPLDDGNKITTPRSTRAKVATNMRVFV
jgi:hypothetical protein